MANTKTAKENILITRRNAKRNLHYKTRMKTLVKKALLAVESGAEDREKIVREALRNIDKTVSKGVVKKSTAARKKSRLAIRLHKSLATAAQA